MIRAPKGQFSHLTTLKAAPHHLISGSSNQTVASLNTSPSSKSSHQKLPPQSNHPPSSPSLYQSVQPPPFPTLFESLRYLQTHSSISSLLLHTFTMADQVSEILEIPSEFAKDGVQFIRRCTKRTFSGLTVSIIGACSQYHFIDRDLVY